MDEAALPDIVTHIFHPGRGAFRNLCELPDEEAQRIVAAMRDAGRPRLTPAYLARRRRTEDWLLTAAAPILGRRPDRRPVYAFLGSFGHLIDPSRPAAIRLARPSLGTVSFTIGDSMSVAARPDRRLLNLDALRALHAAGALGDCRFTDEDSAVGCFVEVQIWDRGRLPPSGEQ